MGNNKLENHDIEYGPPAWFVMYVLEDSSVLCEMIITPLNSVLVVAPIDNCLYAMVSIMLSMK